MTLINLIQSISDWQNKTDFELWQHIIAISETITDPTLRSYDGVGEILGFETSIALQSIIDGLVKSGSLGEENTAVLSAAHTSLIHGRMNFSLSFIQQKLEEFRGIPELAQFIDPLKNIGVQTIRPHEAVTLDQITEARELLLATPNQQSREVLLSVNRQANGDLNVFASVTPVSMYNGQIISRGEPTRLVNGELRDKVLPLIEELLNG